MIGYENKKCKGFACVNGRYVKLKKGYVYQQGQFRKIYSAGNIVTYHVDTNETYQEEVDSDASCLSPKTFTPTKSGWSFVGWREDATATGSVLENRIMGDEPVKLYAVFAQTVTRKFISYDSTEEVSSNAYYNNGNSAKAAINVPNGAAYSGWTWRGWSGINITTANAAVMSESGKTIYTYDSGSVYGLYQRNITLTTVDNGTSTSHTGVRYYNAAGNTKNPTFTVSNPSKSGASFLGWSNNGSTTVSNSSISNLTLTSNTTLWAVFKYSNATLISSLTQYVISDSTYGAANGQKTKVITNVDGNAYSSVQITLTADLQVGKWTTSNWGTVMINSVILRQYHSTGSTLEGEGYATEQGDYPCSSGKTATISVSIGTGTQAINLISSGQVQSSWANITSMISIGRTVVG